jgi:cardiolipin synthase
MLAAVFSHFRSVIVLEWAIWGSIFALLDVAMAVGVTIHAVLWKRDTRAVIGWVGLAWLAPFFGSVAYLCLGINRIERKAESLNRRERWSERSNFTISPDELHRVEAIAGSHPNLIGLGNAGKQITGQTLAPGNDVQPLIDGDQAYPAMIDAIAGAKRSVSLLSYIFDCDRAGEAFVEALTDAQRRDIAVRVLIDDVGSKYSRPNMVDRLKKSGIAATSFLPTRIARLPTFANLRNHRKILVVDGKVGFTGGTNIREGHCLKLEPKEPVQCLHFRLKGPVVSQLQRVFAIDWAFAAGEDLAGEDWFPMLDRAGTVWARGIEHGPDENFEKLADLIAAALASARNRVRIVTPYFLPNPSLIQALNVASLRGVDVEIYLPSVNNIVLVQWAATAQLWQVLEKGCRVFYTEPPFDHTKVMIVDDVWALIGSTNWDPRSLRLNFEFNVECYDPELAASLSAIIDTKAQSAREVELDDVNARTYPIRLRDGLARLLTPYL